MKLESQVVSLELSKKLKELGVKQESLWWWLPSSDGKYHIVRKEVKEGFKSLGWFKEIGVYSAFTVAELGEMLPSHFVSWRVQKRYYICEQLQSIKSREKKELFANTEVNARAKMRIYLIEKKLIEL